MIRPRFSAPLGIERELERQLRKIARNVGSVTRDRIGAGGLDAVAAVDEVLRRYAEELEPWAEDVAAKAIRLIGTHNLAAWEKLSGELGRTLRSTFAGTALGAVARELHQAQVELITSLPIKAAERAQEIARKAQLEGVRASAIRDAILALDRTGDVTEARATLIARTEVAKANASFTQARAQYVGASSYIWRTMVDAEVRDEHAALEGEVFRWDDPPFVSEAEGAHHPGEIWNCRCFAEPLITKGQVDPGREAAYQQAAGYDLEDL